VPKPLKDLSVSCYFSALLVSHLSDEQLPTVE
jgi:hypothetical protein